MESLNEQRPLYRLNEKGERVYLDDNAREQLRQHTRQVIERNCDSK
jgi:hypothetical protein